MNSYKITSTRTPEEELRSRLHVHLQQDGGNPSQLLEMLDLAVSKKVWDEFDMSFRQFIESSYESGGLGWSIENLKSVLRLKHRYEYEGSGHAGLIERIVKMRQQVVDLLNEPIGVNGGDRKSVLYYQTDSLSGNGGTSIDYTVRRLKKDNPELAEKVIKGELSANAAAIQAGFRPVRYSLPGDPIVAGRYLAERVDKEWFYAMVAEYEKVAD